MTLGALLILSAASLPAALNLRAVPGCEVDRRFRTRVPVPQTFATSTLAGGSCDGHCVAFCVIGQVDTFFDANVHKTYADVLISKLGNAGRNDVIFVWSDEQLLHAHSQSSGDPIPEPTCDAYSGFKSLVSILHEGGQQRIKENRCLAKIAELEAEHKNRYSYVVRTRTDHHWKGMPFSVVQMAGTNHPGIAYDDQFLIIRRDAVKDTLNPREYRSLVDQWNATEYNLFRSQSWFGMKSRWFINPTRNYFQKGAARHENNLTRLSQCVDNIIAIACDHYVHSVLKQAALRGKLADSTAPDFAHCRPESFNLRQHLSVLRQSAQRKQQASLSKTWLRSLAEQLDCELRVNRPRMPTFDKYGCSDAYVSGDLRTSLAFRLSVGWVPKQTGEMGEC